MVLLGSVFHSAVIFLFSALVVVQFCTVVIVLLLFFVLVDELNK